jgi:hypothetical protein
VDVPNIITYIVLDRESFVSWLATQERVWEQSSVFLLFSPTLSPELVSRNRMVLAVNEIHLQIQLHKKI